MRITPKRILAAVIILIVGFGSGYLFGTLLRKAEDFNRYAEARNAAPDKEEFDRNFDNMVKWFEDYKRDNPGATDEDAQRAFEELWDKN